MKLKYFRLLIVALFLFCATPGYALSYSSVVTFGDSLSDNGNVDRFTDGELWVEHLANDFSANLSDFAYGGATTWYDNPALGSPVTGLLWQVDTFGPPALGGFPASETLVTVWAGANDFLQSRSYYEAVTNIDTALQKLYATGGRNFLVPNLPDIGKTPAFYLGNPVDAKIASAWTLAYNKSLNDILYDFENLYRDANIISLDTFSIFDKYVEGSPEWSDLFWADGFHPSSVGHNLIYEEALSVLQPVPEPTTILLFGTGLIGLAGLSRRKKK
jgi:phospholipase/lecithinase/hemolysin